jgi:rubrerythrin
LTWRCDECGELGDIEALPEECPNCGADRTEVFYAIED